ncbi:MAG: CHASE2 domain-containing protein, partial [Alphaproteobacteria bacterium]
MTRWLLSAVPYLVLLLALALKAADPPFIEQARNLIFDSYQRMKPRDFDAAQSPVAIVDVDDESLSKLGQWPWPRPLLAKLVAKLHAAGAATVAFDVVFAEPDRSSPENVLPLWPKSPEIDAVRAHLADLPRHDAEFAKVLAESRAVTAFVLSTDEVGRKPAVKTGFAVAGDDPSPFLYGFKNAIVNLPELEAAALGNGAVNWLPSRDQVIRRVPTIFRIGTEKYPTLFVEALRVAQDAKTIIIKSSGASGEASFGESTGIVSIKVGAFVIPTDANGQVVAYFNKSSPARYVSAWRVLEPDFKPERIDGKIVLFGTSAKGLFDLRTTPLDPAIPGVEVHAQIIEQVVTKAFLSRPDFAPAVELLYVLLLGLILILIVPRVGAVWAGFVGMAGIAAAVYGGWYAFASNLKFLLDGVYAGAALLVVFMSATLVVYLRTAREREQVRGAFSRYMSPVLVEQLADHPEKLTLGGEMRDMTIMFSDIRGFTAISEKFDAHGLTNFINRYLTPMTDIILTERGTI